jgi:hypothetical protein
MLSIRDPVTMQAQSPGTNKIIYHPRRLEEYDLRGGCGDFFAYNLLIIKMKIFSVRNLAKIFPQCF